MNYFSTGRLVRKARRGSMPRNVETLMKMPVLDKSKLSSEQFRSFALTLRDKLANYGAPASVAPVSRPRVDPEEAIAAAKLLSKPRSMKQHGHSAALMGGAAPVIGGLTRATKGFLDTKGGLGRRIAGAAKGVTSASLGDVASQTVGGALTGGVVSAGREGIQVANARRTVQDFVREHTGKR